MGRHDRGFRLLLAGMVLAAAILAGCMPGWGSPPGASRPPALEGRIEHVQIPLPGAGPSDRTAQALTSDVAKGATVSLIETDSGKTVATAVSSDRGEFSLDFPNGFLGARDKPYYLEAVKGLPVGGAANRAGAAIARVRTLVVNDWSSWSSLSGGSITISRATTALSIIAAHRDLPISDQLGLLGKVSGTSFASGGTPIAAEDFDRVLALVSDALLEDQDPVESIGYFASGTTAALRYARKVGTMAFHETLNPAVVSIGESVTVAGQNFPGPGPATPSLTLAGVPVTTWSVDPTRTRLTFTVPAGSYAGYLQLSQAGSTWIGPFVRVRGTVGTFVGTGVADYREGPGLLAQITMPHDLGLDAAGNLYFKTTHRIPRVSPGGMVSSFVGSGVAGTQDGTGTAAQFNGPGFTIDSSGNLLVKNYNDNRFAKVTPQGVVTTFLPPNSTFSLIHQLAVDAAGDIYVADFGNHCIRKLTQSGVITTVAGAPGSAGSADGAPLDARFNNPSGVAVDPAGKLLIVNDRSNGRIRKIDLDANKTWTLGSSGWEQNPGSVVGFRGPQHVAIGPDGNYYTAEFGANRVRRITPSGAVTAVAEGGGYVDGAIAGARLMEPHGIAVDALGTIYVSEYGHHRIRAIVP